MKSVSSATERTVYQAKPHWVYLLKPALFMVLGLSCTCCTGLFALAEPPPGQTPPPSEMIGCFVTISMIILGIALLGTIKAAIDFINSDFILTNRRVIVERGGIRHRSLEIFLKHVDSVVIETSPLGKLFGYGTVVINSGVIGPILIRISNPQEIRNRIQDQIARL